MEIRPMTQAEQKYTFKQSMQIESQTCQVGICGAISALTAGNFIPVGTIPTAGAIPMNLRRNSMK